MVRVRQHREARKEFEALPAIVQDKVVLVLAAIGEDPLARGLAREVLRGYGKRRVLTWGTVYRGIAYRMAWEVVGPEDALVYAYGPHEGFYGRLERRAKAVR